MLSQWLQCIMLRIHQYRAHNIYKPGPTLYITDWLFLNNNAENRDKEVTGINYAIRTSVSISHRGHTSGNT